MENSYGRLEIGGYITKEQQEAIAEIAEDEGIPDLDEALADYVFEDSEAKQGVFDDLEAYLYEQKIPYTRYSAADGENGGVISVYRPAEEYAYDVIADASGNEPIIYASAVRELLDDKTLTPEKKLEALARRCRPIPPLPELVKER